MHYICSLPDGSDTGTSWMRLQRFLLWQMKDEMVMLANKPSISNKLLHCSEHLSATCTCSFQLLQPFFTNAGGAIRRERPASVCSGVCSA